MEAKGANHNQVKFPPLVLLKHIYTYEGSGNFHSKRKGKMAFDV